MKTKTNQSIYKRINHLAIFIFLLMVNGCDVNKAPKCSITNPDKDEKIQQGEIVTISVDADDPDGFIMEVRFYIDEIGVISTDSFPYNYDWNTTSENIGIHTIKATAKDQEGKSATDEIEIEIGISPTAAFSANQTVISVGSQIQFYNESFNDPTSWEWDFGDGSTSEEQNPSHTFSSVGNHIISLSATNAFGSDTVKKIGYISVLPNNIELSSLTDSRDGKTYNTVKIGDQWWLAKNLNYESSNGSRVENDTSYAIKYGRLYDWETAKNVCPSGWHLPSDDEWKQLEMDIGMSQSEADDVDWRGTNEGLKLKASYGWIFGGNGTNEYGFTALPGGYCNTTNLYVTNDKLAFFWSSTESNSYEAFLRFLSIDYNKVSRVHFNKGYYLSVRCVKD